MDSKAECDQLKLAHVARKNMKKEETKTNKHQCPLNSVQVQDLKADRKEMIQNKDMIQNSSRKQYTGHSKIKQPPVGHLLLIIP